MTIENRMIEIRQEIERLGEQIEDLALDLLREAVEQGATARPPQEKPLMVARRSLDKAARALDQR